MTDDVDQSRVCDSSKENYFPTNIFLIDQHDVLYVVYSIFVNKVKTHLEVGTMIRNICSTTQRRERDSKMASNSKMPFVDIYQVFEKVQTFVTIFELYICQKNAKNIPLHGHV